jgi:prophage DNA circulation protein
MDGRDALLKECRAGSEGQLILSRLGEIDVELLRCVEDESVSEGGKANFTLEFVEPGQRNLPAYQKDTAGLLATGAADAEKAVTDGFADKFSIDGMAQFVLDDAVGFLDKGLDALRSFNGRVAGPAALFGEVAGRLDEIGREVTSLVLAPRALAGAVIGVVRSAVGVLQSVDGAVAGYRHLRTVLGDVDPVPGAADTPMRRQQQENKQALRDLMLVACAVEVTAHIGKQSAAVDVETNDRSPFDSYNHAIEVRDALSAELDDLALRADDQVYRQIVAVRVQLVEHIEVHGARLERVQTIQLERRRPALAVAHELYGNIDRVDDIVRRNGIRHPGFMPERRDIEVLSA